MLPGPVADFLNFIGINWPNVNEDKVREFGEHVAQFGRDLDGTHQGATNTIKQVGDSYQGAAYEQLFATWGRMSSEHMSELVTGCHFVSEACDIGADVIIGMKVEAIAQLVVMAAEFIADQAAAVATFGIAEAGLLLIEEEGQQLVKFLEQELIGYIEGKVIDAAFTPLIAKIEGAVEGLVFKGTAAALGVPAGGTGTSFSIAPSQVLSLAETFGQHAEEFEGTANQFASTAEGMNFSE